MKTMALIFSILLFFSICGIGLVSNVLARCLMEICERILVLLEPPYVFIMMAGIIYTVKPSRAKVGRVTKCKNVPASQYKTGKDQGGKKYAYLGEAVDEVLINIAYDQTQKESNSTNSFNEDYWWKAITDGFFDETGIRFENKQIKDRLINLYIKCKERQEVHLDSKKISASTFPVHEKLTATFKYLDGESVEPFTAPRKEEDMNPKFSVQSSRKDEISDCHINFPTSNSVSAEVQNELNITEKDMTENPQGINKPVKAEKKSGLLEFVKQLLEFFYNIKKKDASVSIAACVKVLEDTEDVLQQAGKFNFYWAVEYFLKNPERREAFMAMKYEHRLGWLGNLELRFLFCCCFFPYLGL